MAEVWELLLDATRWLEVQDLKHRQRGDREEAAPWSSRSTSGTWRNMPPTLFNGSRPLEESSAS
jgi:hypothetical protein